MHGLIKNHYYKIISNLRMFFIFIILAGIIVTVFDNKNTGLLMGFSYLSIIGFPLSAMIGICKKNVGKWNQYILTFPLKRSDIVKSVFLTQAAALVVGILITGLVFTLSFLIHGFSFYRYVDVLLLFSSSIGIALFMSALFFPLSCIDSKDRTETIGILSLLIGIGMMMGIISIINILFERPTNMQLIMFSIGVQSIAVIFYTASYFITTLIYLKWEL